MENRESRAVALITSEDIKLHGPILRLSSFLRSPPRRGSAAYNARLNAKGVFDH